MNEQNGKLEPAPPLPNQDALREAITGLTQTT